MIFGLFAFIVLATAQDRPIGYGRSATGGEGGVVVTVDNLESLRTQLTTSGKRIIVVTKDITVPQDQWIHEVIVDKTLLGMKGVRLISKVQDVGGGIMNLKPGTNNFIIRNLIFEGPGAYDVDGDDLITNNGANNFWVDHCEFWDGLDGNFDNNKDADNITISWVKFGYKKAPKAGGSGGSDDHRFSNLIAGGASTAPKDGHYSITFDHCMWADGCKQRMPRARNAELHILNCLYDTSVSGSIALGLEGGINGLGCYVEGTYFKNVTEIYRNSDTADSQPHTVTFVDCLASKSLPANHGSTPRPTYPYSVTPVKEVEALVSKGAGATLTVTTAGVVS